MTRTVRCVLTAIIFGIAISAPCYGSQIANHVSIAYEAMEHPETPAIIKDVLARNPEAYKQGPPVPMS